MELGLNGAQRLIIREMVHNGESEDYIINEIRRLVNDCEWSFDANVDFIGFLSNRGYYDAAKKLERCIYDR